MVGHETLLGEPNAGKKKKTKDPSPGGQGILFGRGDGCIKKKKLGGGSVVQWVLLAEQRGRVS